jgi:hypothetical protein
MKIPSIHIFAASILLLACLPAAAAPKAPLKAWTDPAAVLREDPDFAMQGEYAEATAGVQVVALGDGRFDAYLLEGGLPGAGWAPGKARTALKGGRQGDEVVLKDDAGKTTATIRKDRMVVVGTNGVKRELVRTERGSLTGKDNECGGIYSISKPRLNMCLPPLAWQTYDVEFTAAKFDASGKRTAWPRITVKLNGVLVHENLELAKDFTTSAPITKPLDGPEGPVFFQNHGNPVVFRNIWIVPGKEA